MSDSFSNSLAGQLDQSLAAGRELEMKRLRDRFGSGKDQKQELREACTQFEAIFIQRIWEQMRATVPKEGYLHSREQDMYTSMFDQEMSMEMARGGGIGLADLLYGQLKERLERSGAEAASEAVDLNPVPSRQNFPSKKVQDEAIPAKELNTDQVNRILGMNSSPEERMDLLARQIKASLGDKNDDLPELEKKLDEVENGLGDGMDLPPLHWPVPGSVSSGFGWREDPFTGKQAWHAGLDFAVPQGTPVESCWPGRVTFSGEKGGFGNKVIIEHAGGWKSVYAHNSENLVQVGDRVEAGQKIAKSGNTGRSTGPHLHFELRQGDLAWNPKMIKDRLLAGLSIGHAGKEDT
ncbi:peptidoglycan DD-metalloendopeptidase family protein [Desulfonatronovibrio hydrogenovorans]|uniref:peptidoglycan DD-metalloendopeptidase family protein n=1 Tax=Desulfonatronovibrio hydrogenovorans TaxID=53245 RepID=UPI00068A48AE|nr:peptidoglycan DD-metalloendopeptidase family protein [Desulfonatronovibrio hydrogenovorans]